jgi:hypothetical protein
MITTLITAESSANLSHVSLIHRKKIKCIPYDITTIPMKNNGLIGTKNATAHKAKIERDQIYHRPNAPEANIRIGRKKVPPFHK